MKKRGRTVKLKGMNPEQFKKHKEFNILKDKFTVNIIATTLLNDRDKVGIHLSNPSIYDKRDAIETAERDLFPTIYCHYSNVVSLDNYRKIEKAS